LSGHIQPSVNNPETNGNANGHELKVSYSRALYHCPLWIALVYSTVNGGLTYTYLSGVVQAQLRPPATTPW